MSSQIEGYRALGKENGKTADPWLPWSGCHHSVPDQGGIKKHTYWDCVVMI